MVERVKNKVNSFIDPQLRTHAHTYNTKPLGIFPRASPHRPFLFHIRFIKIQNYEFREKSFAREKLRRNFIHRVEQHGSTWRFALKFSRNDRARKQRDM